MATTREEDDARLERIRDRVDKETSCQPNEEFLLHMMDRREADLNVKVVLERVRVKELEAKVAALMAAWESNRKRWLREGFAIAEADAMIEDSNGYHPVRPYISWSVAEKSLEAAINAPEVGANGWTPDPAEVARLEFALVAARKLGYTGQKTEDGVLVLRPDGVTAVTVREQDPAKRAFVWAVHDRVFSGAPGCRPCRGTRLTPDRGAGPEPCQACDGDGYLAFVERAKLVPGWPRPPMEPSCVPAAPDTGDKP